MHYQIINSKHRPIFVTQVMNVLVVAFIYKLHNAQKAETALLQSHILVLTIKAQ